MADGRLQRWDDAADEDTLPPLPARPTSRRGDVWRLGEHRLLCGDATDAEAVRAFFGSREAALLFTSPPYAQQREYGEAKEAVAEWDTLMCGVFVAAPLARDAQVLVNLGLVHRDREWQPYWDRWIRWMRFKGWRRFGWYVWDQGPGLPGDWGGRLAPAHEFIFHFNRVARKPHKTVPCSHAGETLGGGGLRLADGTVKAKHGAGADINSHRIPDSVVRVMRHKGAVPGGSHPAVFPVALVEEVLKAWSEAGDLVFEPFGGSGSQIVAAEKLDRVCFAVELDPAYCDVAVRRWQTVTGREAVLEGDGRGFSAVGGERVLEACRA